MWSQCKSKAWNKIEVELHVNSKKGIIQHGDFKNMHDQMMFFESKFNMFAHETRYDIRIYTLCIAEGTSLAPSISATHYASQLRTRYAVFC